MSKWKVGRKRKGFCTVFVVFESGKTTTLWLEETYGIKILGVSVNVITMRGYFRLSRVSQWR